MNKRLAVSAFLVSSLGAFFGSVSGAYLTDLPLEGRAVEIANESTYSITHVFAKPHNSRRGWGEDILGEDVVLKPGSTTRISLDDDTSACRYDMRVVLATRESLLQSNVDVCGRKKTWQVRNTSHDILAGAR